MRSAYLHVIDRCNVAPKDQPHHRVEGVHVLFGDNCGLIEPLDVVRLDEHPCRQSGTPSDGPDVRWKPGVEVGALRLTEVLVDRV